MGGLLFVAQPLVVALAVALRILHDGVAVLDADGIVEPPNSTAAAPKVSEFAGLAERGRVPNHMIVNMVVDVVGAVAVVAVAPGAVAELHLRVGQVGLAAQVGGIGIAPGANINYKSGHAIFEATHGTAPDIAGKNIANPSSLILSGVMMFEYLGWQEVAELIKIALSFSFRNGNLTADLGGKLSTSKFSDVLIDFIKTY